MVGLMGLEAVETSLNGESGCTKLAFSVRLWLDLGRLSSSSDEPKFMGSVFRLREHEGPSNVATSVGTTGS